jgi:hypothetical protein
MLRAVAVRCPSVLCPRRRHAEGCCSAVSVCCAQGGVMLRAIAAWYLCAVPMLL